MRTRAATTRGSTPPRRTRRSSAACRSRTRHGAVTFRTIYPGWYQGRATHIHLKVHVGGSVVHTGQLFFDETTNAVVYAGAPYSVHPGQRTTNDQDGIYANGGAASTLALTPRGRIPWRHPPRGADGLSARRVTNPRRATCGPCRSCPPARGSCRLGSGPPGRTAAPGRPGSAWSAAPRRTRSPRPARAGPPRRSGP